MTVKSKFWLFANLALLAVFLFSLGSDVWEAYLAVFALSTLGQLIWEWRRRAR
jgi:hypothetical protein